MLYRTVIILFISALFGVQAKAQSSCSQTLREAQLTYEKGRIDLVPKQLTSCLQSGFNKEEQIAAYKLLVNTYLYFNERRKAEEAMASFLTLNPEYEIDTIADPSEFINLYNSFRTTPVFLYGGKFGSNMTGVNVTKNFSLDNSAVSRGEYSMIPGFNVSLAMEFPLTNRISIAPELQFSQTRHEYKDLILGFAALSFQETRSLISLPVLFKYNIGSFGKENNITPFINLGGTPSYLLATVADIVREDQVSGENQREVSGPSIEIKEQRVGLNYAATAGAGVKLKNFIGRGYIIADFKYSYGLNNVVNTKNRIVNSELVYKYLYVDNDFSINTYTFTIGYLIPKYKPKLMVKKSKQSKSAKK